MSSDRSSAADSAGTIYGDLAKKSYGVGIPMLQRQLAMAQSGIDQGGMPTYLANAFDVQRGSMTGQTAFQDQAAQGAAGRAGGQLAAHGNPAAALTPQAMGSHLAKLLTESRVQQGMAGVEETNALTRMQLGGSGVAGNASLAAAGAQLQGVSMLPGYNSTLATVLGGANLAGSVYGGYQNWASRQTPGQRAFGYGSDPWLSGSGGPGLNE